MAKEGEKVVLNVYDLSQGLARQLSSTFLGKSIEGIWHTGVVVYGKEYYFGGGIQHNPAGQTPYGNPCKVIELGVTHIPVEVFEEYLEEISPRYTVETYSLMHHNCNNFSSEVVQFLVGSTIPDFILRLPEEVMNSPMGALIMPMIMQFESTLRYGGVPQVPQYGAGLSTPKFRQQQGILNIPNKPDGRGNSNQSKQSDGSEQKNIKPTSSIPAAVKPVSDQLDGSPNSNDRQLDNCKKGVNENGATHFKKDGSLLQDPLGDARAKVQEEITREFAKLMANGSLRASEAAALATRRVMKKHGTLNGTPSQR
uniref:PPPDE domain-containing protein n=1 Tax=Araucaria cunninghamii TaxID=56994 RepID=A0A0D6R5M4_ARACU